MRLRPPHQGLPRSVGARNREASMALAQVLWGMSLLLIIASALTMTSSTSYTQARIALQLAQEEATLDAATNRAVLGLLDRRPEQRWRIDEDAKVFSLNSVSVRLVLQDELGRIDPNHADKSTVASLLRSVGLDTSSADKLSDKILDWREPGTAKRLNGAKHHDYAMANLPQRPRGGPFQSVDELLLVMDMTPALFERLESALTVYSGRQFVDPQAAPRETLLAFPGMTEPSIGELITHRNKQPTLTGPPLEGRVFRIRLTVDKPNNPSRDVLVRLIGDGPSGYWGLKGR